MPTAKKTNTQPKKAGRKASPKGPTRKAPTPKPQAETSFKSERHLAGWIEGTGQDWVREYPFTGINGNRRWRFDFALTELRVAIEYDEGLFLDTGSEYINDCEKYSEAAACGWIVLRVPAPGVGGSRRSVPTIRWLERWIAAVARITPDGVTRVIS